MKLVVGGGKRKILIQGNRRWPTLCVEMKQRPILPLDLQSLLNENNDLIGGAVQRKRIVEQHRASTMGAARARWGFKRRGMQQRCLPRTMFSQRRSRNDNGRISYTWFRREGQRARGSCLHRKLYVAKCQRFVATATNLCSLNSRSVSCVHQVGSMYSIQALIYV